MLLSGKYPIILFSASFCCFQFILLNILTHKVWGLGVGSTLQVQQARQRFQTNKTQVFQVTLICIHLCRTYTVVDSGRLPHTHSTVLRSVSHIASHFLYCCDITHFTDTSMSLQKRKVSFLKIKSKTQTTAELWSHIFCVFSGNKWFWLF